jgi:hypothetical protein
MILPALLLCLIHPLAAADRWRVAVFEADVTPPLGHACMGGGIEPVKSVADPLHARGCVLLGPEKPVVIVSVEWCEIRNESYDEWRSLLAEAAGTEPWRVLVSATHAHNAPVMDAGAERLLRAASATGSVCDPAFGTQAVKRVAEAVRAALPAAKFATHYGIGQARVQEVASNRRVVLPDGRISYARMSRCKDPTLMAAEEGTVDPWLKTLSFWSGDECLIALHSYAVHPMSYYGQGDVTADFPGLALKAMRASHPGPLHVYASGCSGNVTAGKYNDGSHAARLRLAARLHEAMAAAMQSTTRHSLSTAMLARTELRLEPRSSPGFTQAALEAILADARERPFSHCLAAMGLSWRARLARGTPIDVCALHLGKASLLLLPAESYVEYQLHAQELAGGTPVLVMGYGESAPGYIPIERAWAERDTNLHDWCWVAPGSEARMKAAIEAVIRR